jgi:hypothetical protein
VTHTFFFRMTEKVVADPDAFIEILKLAAIGDRVEIDWRVKPSPPEQAVQADASWVTWTGVVFKDWKAQMTTNALIVDWDAGCPRLVGKRRCYLPQSLDWPDPDCDYTLPRLIRQTVRHLARREVPNTPAPPPRPPAKAPIKTSAAKAPPTHGIPTQGSPDDSSSSSSDGSDEDSSSDSSRSDPRRRRHKKRHRSRSSDSSEQRLDMQAGHKVRLTTIVEGLRVPTKIAPQHKVWYPVFFRDAEEWETRLTQRMQSVGTQIQTQKTQALLDSDVQTMKEFIRLRGLLTEQGESILLQDDSSITLRPMFSIIARIAGTLIQCSMQFAQGACEKFLEAFSASYVEGRLDFERLWLTAVNVPKVTKSNVMSDIPIDVTQVRSSFRPQRQQSFRSQRQSRQQRRKQWKPPQGTKTTKNE